MENVTVRKRDSMGESVPVPEKAKQAESTLSEWEWVDRAIWTEHMQFDWLRWATTPLNERQVKLLNRLFDGFEGRRTSSK